MKNGDSRLGILAFLGGTALVLVALVAFARYPSLFRRGHEYHANFGSVAGLNLGDEVRYGGLLVGSVTRLRLDPEDPTRIRVTFRVRPQTPMRSDTRAAISQIGFLGEPYLGLVPGRPDAPPLAAGSTVASADNLSFQEAMSRLALFLDRADTLLHGVERVAATSPWDRFDRTLQRVDVLLTDATEGSNRVFGRLDAASTQLNDVLSRTERLITRLDSSVRGAGPELRTAQREALAAVHDMRMLVSDLRAATGNGDRLESILRNMDAATTDLARLAARLERDPASVLKRQQPPRKTAGPAAQ